MQLRRHGHCDEPAADRVASRVPNEGGEVRHGDPAPADTLDALAVLDSHDADLALVVADMDTWADAHPCDCDAMCECDE